MTDQPLKWYDIADWGVEGKGWAETAAPYDRLPARAEGTVTDGVWGLSHSATGMCAHFNTDSPRIHARWTLGSDQLGEDNFNVTGFSGVDLYAFDDNSDAWRWAGSPWHFTIKDRQPDTVLVEHLPPGMRRFRLYLPLRNPVLKVEVGVDAGATFEPVAPRACRPLVHYGTSIVHGAFAVRAGLGTSQLLGRRLDLPLINLGFSGSARMEPEFAALLAELDARVFILDPLANMDTELVEERAETFIRILAAARPETPIVMVEDAPNTRAWLNPWNMDQHRRKWRAFHRVYRKLRRQGVGRLHYVRGEKLFGTDGEASMDGVHPSDVGYMRMADILEKTLRKALSQP